MCRRQGIPADLIPIALGAERAKLTLLVPPYKLRTASLIDLIASFSMVLGTQIQHRDRCGAECCAGRGQLRQSFYVAFSRAWLDVSIIQVYSARYLAPPRGIVE